MSRTHRYTLIVLVAIPIFIIGVLFLYLKRRPETVYPTADDLLREPSVESLLQRTPDDKWYLRWTIPAKRITLRTGKSPQQARWSKPIATVSDQQEITIAGLPMQAPRYFSLEWADGTYTVVSEREVQLEGAVNFRDIGGYRTGDGRAVQWGKVYRAGQLSDLTDGDVQTLTRLGLGLSCDLRLPEEIAEEPDRLPPHTRYEQNSVQGGESRSRQLRRLLLARGRVDQFMTSAYIRVIVDQNADVYARLFERMADEANLPMVVHCTAGKDRTGVAIALLLAFLGVPDDVIAADYSLSNRYFENYLAIGERAIQSVGRLGLTTQAVLPLFTANPDTILATLAHVRQRYGSVEEYLTQVGGLEVEVLKRVQENLLA